jgi:hypothetical protein
MGSVTRPDSEKRDMQRLRVGFPVQYHYEGDTGRGLVLDVSNGGALVDDPSLDVPSGRDITMHLQLGTSTIEMSARVVRPTAKGFAVRFKSSDVRLQGLLEIMISRQGPTSDEID